MSVLSRLIKGGAAHLLTGSFQAGMAAALTDNFGIGVGTGIASRMLNNFSFGGCNQAWGGGYGYGGWGGGCPDYGFGKSMYNMMYSQNPMYQGRQDAFYNTISNFNNSWW